MLSEFDEAEIDGMKLQFPTGLTLTVSVAITKLLETIDGSRALLTSKSASQASAKVKDPLLDKLRKALTNDQRAEVERAVEAMLKARDERMNVELTKVKNKLAELNITADTAANIYPPSPEQQLAGFQLAARRVSRELYEEFLLPFEGSVELEYANTLLGVGEEDSTTELLGKALLPLQLSALEEFLASLLRAALTKYPNGLGTLRNVPFEIIDKYGQNASTGDLKRWAIDRRIEEFVRGSPNEWRKELEGWSRIDIANVGAAWDAIGEAKQRRHAIIHSGSVADGNYIAKVPEHLRPGIFLGSPLTCDYAYIDYLLIELEIFGINLGTRWASHFFGSGPEVTFPLMSLRIVRLENEGRWAKAAAICDSALLISQTATSHVKSFQINRWYCYQEMGLEDAATRRAIQEFEPSDPYERAGKAALLSDPQEFVKAIKGLNNYRHAVTLRHNLRKAPLVRREMAKYPEVRAVMNDAGRGHRTLNSNRKKSRGRKSRR